MRYFSTDNPALVSRRFDNEIVIANYVTGAYYSLTGSGAEIWLGLRAGVSVEEIATRLGANNVATEVDAFVTRLGDEAIIAPVDSPIHRVAWSPAPGFKFSSPLLERFDDLRDLLLLDPVHDVDDIGWPHSANGDR
jgi:hypothetical protein